MEEDARLEKMLKHNDEKSKAYINAYLSSVNDIVSTLRSAQDNTEVLIRIEEFIKYQKKEQDNLAATVSNHIEESVPIRDSSKHTATHVKHCEKDEHDKKIAKFDGLYNFLVKGGLLLITSIQGFIIGLGLLVVRFFLFKTEG